MEKNNLNNAMEAVRQFANKKPDNICFGFIADTATFKVSSFAKGDGMSIVAMLCAEMGRNDAIKDIVKIAYEVFFNSNKIQQLINQKPNEN